MKIWLNKLQTRRAIEFFRPDCSADIFWGDVYIETDDNEIVFMGCEYPESFSLKDTKFVLDCDEELCCLIAVIKSCDCDMSYVYVTIVDQHGNQLDKFKLDAWSDSIRQDIKNRLKRENFFYDDLSFVFA